MIIGKGAGYWERLISSVCNHSSDDQGNHLENMSEIRTRAIQIVSVCEMEFRSEKDIGRCHGILGMP